MVDIISFKKMKGAIDPRFFESHGKTLEILSKHYGDQLSPELEIIIEKPFSKDKT